MSIIEKGDFRTPTPSEDAFSYAKMENKTSDIFGDYDGFEEDVIEKKSIILLDFTGKYYRDISKLSMFPHLNDLILDQNSLTSLSSFPVLSSLKLLSLNNNLLEDIDLVLSKLSVTCPHLTYLSLLGNPACPDSLSVNENGHNDFLSDDYQRYRYKVIFNLGHLRFLDSSRVLEVEKNRAKVHGGFLKVTRPVLRSNRKCDPEPYHPSERQLHPLSKIDRSKIIYARPAFLTKSNREYFGKQSEGNRFIRNEDL